eukprot:6171992-Pyramimonas_sp.AAC.1
MQGVQALYRIPYRACRPRVGSHTGRVDSDSRNRQGFPGDSLGILRIPQGFRRMPEGRFAGAHIASSRRNTWRC